MQLHDTHVHFDILLEKLNLQPSDELPYRDYKIDFDKLRSSPQFKGLGEEVKNKLNQLLTNHEFALHSTVSTDNFDLASQLFSYNPKIHYFLGSHPELVDLAFDLDEYLNRQERYLKQNQLAKIIGIGEVGLDYHYTQDLDLIRIQKQLFESQIDLALKLNLPLMIHCREAFNDLFAILNNFPPIHSRFLIHCFTGGIEEAKEVLNMGGKIGIGGISTYNNATNLVEAIEFCPIENIVLETDLPFLSPVPNRGQVCLPEYIDNVAKKVADIKGIQTETVWAKSRSNSIEMFDLP